MYANTLKLLGCGGIQPNAKATILIGAGRNFVAGADLNELANASEFGQTLTAKLGHLLGKLETLNRPAVDALNGSALAVGWN